MPLPPDLDSLVRGQHGDPFRLLGPHVDAARRRRRSGAAGRARARSTLRAASSARRARADDPAASRRPVRGARGRPRVARRRHRLPLRGRVRRGGDCRLDDPYRFGRIITDYDLHLFGEGTLLGVHERLGAHPTVARRHRRRALRGVGAQRAARLGGRRLQRVGRPRAPDAAAGAVGRLGAVRSRTSATASATSSRSARRPATCCTRRIRTAATSRCRRGRPRSCAAPRATPGATSAWMAARGDAGRVAHASDVDLRGAPGLVADACPRTATAR